MQDNPFLTSLKIAFTGALAFLVFMAFWQRTHLEDQVSGLTRENAGLSDRVADMGRKVDDLKVKADRLEGAANTIAQIVRDNLGRGGAPSTTAVAPPAAPTVEWGWARNASLDASVDSSRPVGTPGRYRNFLVLDPDPEIPAEAAGQDDGVLSSPYGDDPKGFNFITENAAELTEQLKIYVGGAPTGQTWKDPYKHTPDLCWRVEVSPDHREYTLFFRRDVLWHPPMVDLTKYPHLRGAHRVTARDFKFTLDTIRNPQTDCAPLRGYYTEVESVECPDEYTAVVRWSETLWHSIGFTLEQNLMPEFLYGSGEDGKPFAPETLGQQFNEHFYNQIGVCGCGPYRMASYQRGQWITLERFDDWYGVREGLKYPVKTKRLLVYKDSETTYLKIQSGEIDLTGLNAPQWRKSILENTDDKSPFKDGRIKNYKMLRPVYIYFGWKNTHPLFTDKRVRRALGLACNVKDMSARIFLGRFVPMSSPIFPQSLQADPGLTPMPFDPAAAKALLEEAGWEFDPASGKRFKTVDGQKTAFEFEMLWVAPNPDVETMLNQYKNDLLAIGVVMKPVAVEWNIWQKKAHARDFAATVGGWSTDGWDHDFDQIWHSRGIQDPGSSNYIEFAHPELDRLSDGLRREMNVEKRIEMVRKIGRILYEEQPTTFFGWQVVLGVHASRVRNVTEHTYRTRPFLRSFPMWTSR